MKRETKDMQARDSERGSHEAAGRSGLDSARAKQGKTRQQRIKQRDAQEKRRNPAHCPPAWGVVGGSAGPRGLSLGVCGEGTARKPTSKRTSPHATAVPPLATNGGVGQNVWADILNIFENENLTTSTNGERRSKRKVLMRFPPHCSAV
eukprot:scaffold1220_cov259-Pinguiococcus_pyrenoidosus.AAC.116